MSSTTLERANQDLTTPKFWDTAWLRRHERLVADWRGKRGQRLRRKHRGLTDLLAGCLDDCEKSSASVLELGCVPGGILAKLHEARPQHEYHGLDFASQGLAETEAFFQAIDFPASLHCGDLREFEPPDKYDFVYSCGLVEHFTDPLPIVKDHARLCKPGGRVLITVPNYSGPGQGWLMSRLDPEKLATHNLSIMNVESLSGILKDAGLQKVSAGGYGRGKFSVSCQIRNPWTFALRLGAKAWNGIHRLVPLAPHWHVTIWATGRVPLES